MKLILLLAHAGLFLLPAVSAEGTLRGIDGSSEASQEHRKLVFSGRTECLGAATAGTSLGDVPVTPEICGCMFQNPLNPQSFSMCACLVQGGPEAQPVCQCVEDGAGNPAECGLCLTALAGSQFSLLDTSRYDEWLLDSTKLVVPQAGSYVVSILKYLSGPQSTHYP